MEADEELDFKAVRPKNFSETKFANWVCDVSVAFRETYPALIAVLEQVKQEFRTGYSTERDKAANADEVQGDIFNYKFALTVSVLVDIYTVYKAITNILQKINILPFERLDLFDDQLANYDKMLVNIDMECCPCSMFYSDCNTV